MEQEDVSMSQRELKMLITEKAEEIAAVLFKGKDCELRTSPNGISVIEVQKKVVSK